MPSPVEKTSSPLEQILEIYHSLSLQEKIELEGIIFFENCKEIDVELDGLPPREKGDWCAGEGFAPNECKKRVSIARKASDNGVDSFPAVGAITIMKLCQDSSYAVLPAIDDEMSQYEVYDLLKASRRRRKDGKKISGDGDTGDIIKMDRQGRRYAQFPRINNQEVISSLSRQIESGTLPLTVIQEAIKMREEHCIGRSSSTSETTQMALALV